MPKLKTEPAYALGRSQHETERLIAQSKIYGDSTRRLFKECGIADGMKVLDIGSGAGDVALLLGELVGTNGQVISVDVNATILKTARERAKAAGMTNVKFIAGDARSLNLDTDFDAIVGRFVLMYMADAGDTLKYLITHLRPGGIVAFQEPDYTVYGALYHPDTPLMNQLIGWICNVFKCSGAHLDMGVGLYRLFVEAGLPEPIMHLQAPIGAAKTWEGYQYMGSIFQSLLPLLEKHGLATAEQLDVDTIPERIRKEVNTAKKPFFLPLHISAYTRQIN